MVKRPILIACIGYILGIIYGLYLNLSIALIFLAIICLCYYILGRRKNLDRFRRYIKIIISKRVILLLSIFIVIGYIHISFSDKKYNKIYKIGTECNITGIIEEVEEKSYNNKYIICVKSINNKRYSNIRLLLYTKYILKCGDYINVKAEYIEPSDSRNYMGFSYKDYLKQSGIYGSLKSIDKIQVLNNNISINKFISTVQKHFKNRINDNLSPNTASLFIALLLGDKSDIADEINTNFKESNMAHILAVSGTHVSYVIITISLLLRKIARKLAILVILIILIFFMMLTGFTPSVVRACTMTILALISKLIYTKSDIYNNLAISAFIILLFNPYSLFNIGFQLSYLGTLGIIILANKLNKRIDKLLQIEEHTESKLYLKNILKEKIKAFLINMILISVCVQLFILPIIVINFNTFSLNFLISGIIATPLFSCIMIIGIITIILGPIDNFIFPILEILLNSLLLVSKFISNNPFSQILIATPNIVWVISYYILLISALFSKSKLGIRIIKENATKKLKKLAILLIVICLTIQGIQDFSKRDLNIYFIDVGQGDSTLIVTPHKKTILIDGGGKTDFNVGKNVLVPYLLDRGINKIDYMMISHFDNDHCGGLMYVVEKMKVKNILLAKQSNISIEYENFINLANKKNVNIVIVNRGDIINIENDIKIQIIYPSNKLNFNDLNNNSIVAKVIYRNFTMLFTGDIEEEAEKAILREFNSGLRSTVLKVAHHGSKTSTTEDFLNEIKPKIALIGVGQDNTFGHPNGQVLERLERIGAKIYRTDEMGEIAIKINKNGKVSIYKQLNNASKK